MLQCLREQWLTQEQQLPVVLHVVLDRVLRLPVLSELHHVLV